MFGYRVNDLPRSARAAAFTPGMTTNPTASSYGLVHVAGAPGTLPVGSPVPQGLAPNSQTPATQGSRIVPPFMRPSLYIASTAHMHPPVRVRTLNELPVPASDWTRVAKRSFQGPARIGGRRVIPWPRVFQRWGTEVPGSPGG